MRHVRFPLLATLLLGGIPAGAAPTAEQGRFFETSVRPLLAAHCYRCHGPDKQKAGLRLDSLAAILKGGKSGPAVVPDRPENSRLLRAVGYQDEALQMPPAGKLADRQVADLTRWVRSGAPWPETAATDGRKAGEGHWAFRPPAETPPPAVRDASWVRTPIDHFILAKLEAAGMRPAPPADRRTLIRRATFDLTGLPPTPGEIDAFLKDDSPGGFPKLVDRLLASPAYGERWGRHWLDVARYADSNGLDENVAYGNAWRYRDYVVAAFNNDKPYDRFVLEQLAGDLLPGGDESTRHERLVATGFLSLGPKVLAEVDEKKMEMDIVDEQIDTVGKAFLGLTLGCARCHDHKFDPIDTEDYYALAGVFTSTRTMENFTKVARWYENPLPTAADRERLAAHAREVARQKEAIQAAVRRAQERLRANPPPGPAQPPKDPEALFPDEAKAELKRLREELAKIEKAAPEVPSAMGAAEGTVADVAVHVRGSHLKLGKVVHRRVPRVLAGAQALSFDARQSGRLQLARWMADPAHPLTARVMVNRVWRWHFGRGLVRTPDNFGLLGEPPTHPELLDWLATRFVSGGWSVKALHRSILLSNTYQMSSTPDGRAPERDPDNRLHGRAEVRRLEAEAIRDSLLAVGGTLDRTTGGSLLQVKNRDYLFDHTSRDTTRYDSRRRALYLPVIRNNLYDVFGLFDATDATVLSGDRATTTVATQALFLLNSDFVLRASEDLAASLGADDEAGRIRRLYARAYGREATPTEVARGMQLVQDAERGLKESDAAKRRLRAWACLCQVVLAADEFVYVR
jgi:hypothetical protein